MIKNKPSVILVNPQLGENIGMVARAMLNCGLTDLRIVNPRDGWPSETAMRASSGALDSGVIVTLYKSTTNAIADLHYTYATTARPRDMIKDVFTPKAAMADAHTKIADGQNIGVLFGAERSGLENDDIAQASAIITIPLNPEFSSLNLSQAVLLIAYEFMTQGNNIPPARQTITNKTNFANGDTINQFTTRLINEVSEKGFFKSDDMRPTMEKNLTNLIVRHQWTDQEISTLHGILSAFSKRDS